MSPKPFEFIGLGATDVTKPFKFTEFGAIDVTKPYKYIGFPLVPGPCTGRSLKVDPE